MSSTLEMIGQHARHQPHACALVSPERTVSYRDLLDGASARAELLRSIGIGTAALIADNSDRWVLIDIAAQLAGITLVPLPAYFSATQLGHAIADCQADALIVDTCSFRRLDLLGLDTHSGVMLDERTAVLRLAVSRNRSAAVERIAKISYTSGTTGRPKGACLQQSTMDTVAASLQAVTANLRLHRHLALLPLATLLENIAGVYAPLRNGTEVVLPSLGEIGWLGAAGLDDRRMLECIHRHAPDSLILVPQMLEALVVGAETGSHVPSSLRFIAVGGGHVPERLLQRADALGLPVYQGYGLTEAASVVALNTPAARRSGSVGRPLPHARVRIGQRGEIRVSGATFSGYCGEPDDVATELDTGDLGRIDEDGFLYVDGRRKNVFITSFGRNVSPEWIEAVFLQADSIGQIAIFGEARPWNVGVIVPGALVDAHDIQADIKRLNSTLPDYAQLGDWILAEEPFTAHNGLATANGRNCRQTIWAKYRATVAAVYDGYLQACNTSEEEFS